METYADIIIDISHEKVDRPFQYRIPEALAEEVTVGCCVLVPFGRGNTLRKGYVTGISHQAEIEEERIKDIAQTAGEEESVERSMIRLAARMRERYGGTMIQALKTVLPAHRKIKSLEQRAVRLALTREEGTALLAEFRRKKHLARARLTEALLQTKDLTLPYPLISGKLHVSAQTIRALREKGILAVDVTSIYRNPLTDRVRGAGETGELHLSDEQAHVVADVTRRFDEGDLRPSLLHGITGSGKTEVYIRLIEEMVKRKRQAIVLIPEIALTYQTLLRFYRHFGDRVSVMNSTLSPGEKYDQFRRAREGEIDVMIGPRSALFTPFRHPGIIIIDEEHELTYKSESTPRYHARETAIERAALTPDGCTVLLGSATPSLEAYTAAKRGDYRLYTLTKRLTGGTLAKVHVTDLRRELKSGNRSPFSLLLQELMEDRLAREEQTMLFLNRRGLHSFLSCRSCGHVFRCPHCDVSLTEHRGGKLVCHYCGHTENRVGTCPECASPYVSAFKAGTQQIEEEIAKRFPGAKTLRMDADTTRTKNSYEEILSAFADHRADILVGTQMIVKGHDFPLVTLVGVLAADLSLNIQDFRAPERTFQLLTQAAGRAGRGERPGDVVIQTYQPEHYAVTASARQDYAGFYEEEASYRALLQYPPMAHMLCVFFFSKKEEACRECAGMLKERMEEAESALPAGERALFIGPSPALVSFVEDVYRYVLYVKHADAAHLIRLRTLSEETETPPEITIQYDTDPMRSL
ncbi:MAG: primosomal protein N' [Lachnospiraceae bacterium]|nr:primosomal protein N' [Lachnospiraceae bacterium]